MLAVKDKLHGTDYLIWACMMHHVLLEKAWNVTCGTEVRPGSCANFEHMIKDIVGTFVFATAKIPPPSPNQEQRRWGVQMDGRML